MISVAVNVSRVAGTWAWQNVRTNATMGVFLAELREATWYELKMKACNSAGCGNQSTQFATLDYDGSESDVLMMRRQFHSAVGFCFGKREREREGLIVSPAPRHSQAQSHPSSRPSRRTTT